MTIKDVPMMTSDEVEVKLNSVLFTAEWSSGYEFNKEGEPKIEAHRVISIDNSNRFFRTRCSEGCESRHEFSKGCGREKLFGDIENARKYLHELMNNDQVKCMHKIEKIQGTMKYIETQQNRLNKVKAKIPKAIQE